MEQKLYKALKNLMNYVNYERTLNAEGLYAALTVAQEAINIYEDSKLKEEQNDN